MTPLGTIQDNTQEVPLYASEEAALRFLHAFAKVNGEEYAEIKNAILEHNESTHFNNILNAAEETSESIEDLCRQLESTKKTNPNIALDTVILADLFASILIDKSDENVMTLEKLAEKILDDRKIANTFEYKLSPDNGLSQLARNYLPALTK